MEDSQDFLSSELFDAIFFGGMWLGSMVIAAIAIGSMVNETWWKKQTKDDQEFLSWCLGTGLAVVCLFAWWAVIGVAAAYVMFHFARRVFRMWRTPVKQSSPPPLPPPREPEPNPLVQRMQREMAETISLGEAQGIPKEIIEAELENVRERYEGAL